MLCQMIETWYNDLCLWHEVEEKAELWIDGDWLEGDRREYSLVMELNWGGGYMCAFIK